MRYGSANVGAGRWSDHGGPGREATRTQWARTVVRRASCSGLSGGPGDGAAVDDGVAADGDGLGQRVGAPPSGFEDVEGPLVGEGDPAGCGGGDRDGAVSA